MSIGRKRKAEKAEISSVNHKGDWLILVGIGAMAILLATALGQEGEAQVSPLHNADAVAVMSTAAEGAEVLVKPEKETYLPEKESVFESIGEFFADLIFGDR